MKHNLKLGDLVKYHRQDKLLDGLGYKLGQNYEVVQYGLALGIRCDNWTTVLVDDSNDLTDNADHFTLLQCEIVLPRGLR